MSEISEYDKDKKWIVTTLESLTLDMSDVKKDIVGIKLQINTVMTRMTIILGTLMVLGWLAPYILDKSKSNTKTEYKTERPETKTGLASLNFYKHE